MSVQSMSKYVTAAFCLYCYWSQDEGKIFKRKHRIEPPPHSCPRCKSVVEQSLGRYLYEQIYLLKGLLPFFRVRGFAPADAETQPRP